LDLKGVGKDYSNPDNDSKRSSRIETFLSEDFNEKFINSFTNQISTQLESIFVQNEESADNLRSSHKKEELKVDPF
jgi:uncharacterized membrane protein YheB (UPF0754 family)